MIVRSVLHLEVKVKNVHKLEKEKLEKLFSGQKHFFELLMKGSIKKGGLKMMYQTKTEN